MSKQEKHLRIIRLESENVKRLKAVQITPKGDVIQITGANDNGKTSVLDSIFLALKQTLVDAPMPIREGESKARIRLDLGTPEGEIELIVERVFGKGAGLKIETSDGARMPAPQKILDGLIGALSFDPLAFTRMKPKDQYDELRRAVRLEIDVEHLDALNKGDFDRRAEANRNAKERRAQAEGFPLPEAKEPPVDEREILDQIESAVSHNAHIERLKAQRLELKRKADRLENSAEHNRSEAAGLRKRADELEAQARTFEDEAMEAQKAATEGSELPAPVEVSALRSSLENAQRANKAHEARKAAEDRRREDFTAAERFEKQAEEISAKMAARDAEKAKAIEGAKMPVEGLGFGDGIVTYKGVPFQQASSAVQLRVSLGIAMASNPRLRVIRIQDGSLLDEKSMAALADAAKDNDFQIWIERVDTSGKVGIFIEDGSVKAIDGQAPRAEGNA